MVVALDERDGLPPVRDSLGTAPCDGDFDGGDLAVGATGFVEALVIRCLHDSTLPLEAARLGQCLPVTAVFGVIGWGTAQRTARALDVESGARIHLCAPAFPLDCLGFQFRADVGHGGSFLTGTTVSEDPGIEMGHRSVGVGLATHGWFVGFGLFTRTTESGGVDRDSHG